MDTASKRTSDRCAAPPVSKSRSAESPTLEIGNQRVGDVTKTSRLASQRVDVLQFISVHGDGLSAVRQLLQCSSARVHDHLPRAPQENRAVLRRITLEHRHNKDEPLQCVKFED